ncbi:Trk system potassium transporter TrkA [Lutibacter sp. B1]|jgi:trk system potassium uptake protein TrkA|uniref:Trk system potassium transporter TrkA n=1 Tax=Lutibacter sp. B1 TaxID=2725996 RepID=UPI0014577988|nr:Trk system potassium transporter TrkA [Lutibacter sp. B1]NLP58792.1 Trk system potassium transporter TrkA [Lutibacter sp. B1]
MKIIIAGAGDVGFHLAKLLSFESQDIYLVDQDTERLDYASNHIDVITRKGDATSIKLLKELNIQDADIFLAVTESQNTNFTIAVLAKKLGAKKTIARISSHEFVQSTEIDFQEIGIDSMISPGELAADEIKMLLNQSAFNDTIQFENGTLNILGSTLEYNSPLINLTVKEARERFSDVEFITIAIKPENSDETIIPRGKTIYRANDQIYFSTPRESIKKLYKLMGKTQFGVKDVMILGGSKIGVKAARNLCDNKFKIKLIEIDKERAKEVAEKIPNALVIKGDGRNVELLEEENIAGMDAFVAVTGNSETNIMSCLVAKSKGVKKTIALVENMDYINISQAIGVDTLINKKLLAASAIFKHVRKGEVLKLANLHNVDAEVLEFRVKEGSPVTKKIVRDIQLTKKAVFGGVIRNGVAHMTFGDFQIMAGDKAVVFCLPEAIHKVEKLFN